MRAINIIAATAVALTMVPAAIESAFAGSDPKGIWIDDTGRGAVEIKSCENTGDALCGNVVWVKSSDDTNGCGKQIMGGVMPVGQGHWDNGWIYSPEKGRKYDVELTPLSNGNLKVVGYAGLKFLSKTMIWKPAPQDLQLCNGSDPSKGSGSTAAAPLPVTPNVDTKASTRPDKEASTTTTTTAPATTPTPAAKSAEAPPASAPAADSAQAPAKAPATADNDSGNDLGKLKIGDLQLDKFVSKTKDGKCKLDLPWVKVTIDCNNEH